MPDSNSAPDTAGWLAPGAALPPRDPSEPTLAPPVASTPGPHAPDRVTVPPVPERATDMSAAFTSRPPIPGYEVERYVSRGGMGIVYRAIQTLTGRTVALKLTPAADAITRERFLREVRALAAVKHPNIVPVYEAGEWYGFLYCTMEFIPNGTLNDHLDRIRRDLPAAVRLMAKVAHAVEALHTAGILHRDLKPLNILIGADDEPVVADFGLARWLNADSELTITGLPVGTRQYMSPEQTRGGKEQSTAACDVWALGVTLYELLTGQRPFDDGVTDVYHLIRTAEPPPLAALSPDVPAALHAVVMKCLAKNPTDRYLTAAALADDLEKFARGEPVSVLPGMPPEPPAATIPVIPVENVKKPRPRRVGLMVCAVASLLIAVAAPPRPSDAEPKAKTFAERFAAGPVKVTDDKGKLLVEAIHEPEHALQEGTFGGYHTLTSHGVGIASVNDDRLDPPYRVTADVAVVFQTNPRSRAGVYVGRRVWGGLPVKHESFVWAGISPEDDTTRPADPARPRNWLIRSEAELYWWSGYANGSAAGLSSKVSAWDQNGKREEVRFARVVIDVRAAGLEMSVDEHSFNALTEEKLLGSINQLGKRRQKFGFPAYEFRAPVLGSGIGLFCQDGQYIVRNLTVSKLKP